jgi:hypothetical protein
MAHTSEYMEPPKLHIFFPMFVPDKLVLQEVAYQTIINGVGEILYRDKKAIWPPLPLWIDSYSFANTKKAQDEVDVFLSYHFREEIFKRHDPKKVVKEHFTKLGIPWEYTSTTWEEEEVHCGAKNI